MFFFEKKNQKTFASLRALVTSPRQRTKVFCFFFSKKKTFLSLFCAVGGLQAAHPTIFG
jgi:hypothetical protein